MRFFNDHEPYAAAWLRNLYPKAEIDGRDIADLRPDDLRGYERVHLFAGIGGWEHALDLAGWEGEVWTGSCPCQPFSSAGKRKGEADERHLWPEFRRLIAECRPPTIFGEQVASSLGRRWLAGVRADLEALGYRFGAADLCAASAGAPHIRQRLFWVADTKQRATERHGHDVAGAAGRVEGGTQERQRVRADAGDGGEPRRLADTQDHGQPWLEGTRAGRSRAAHDSRSRRMADTLSGKDEQEQQRPDSAQRRGRQASDGTRGRGSSGGVGDTGDTRLQGFRRSLNVNDAEGWQGARRLVAASGVGFWDAYDILPMLDGKARRVRPGSFPLAHGVSARVAKLRAIGNAIVPQVAAVFIRAFLESEDSMRSKD